MSAVSSIVSTTFLHAFKEERHFALVDDFAFANPGSLVITFRSENSVRPMHLFGHNLGRHADLRISRRRRNEAYKDRKKFSIAC